MVASSEYCTLQSSCEVIGRDEHENGVTVHYLDSTKTPSQLHAAWLVGADGKRGIVRKHFLEPSAGVRQETGIFEYEGTWIAANIESPFPRRKATQTLLSGRLDLTQSQYTTCFGRRTGTSAVLQGSLWPVVDLVRIRIDYGVMNLRSQSGTTPWMQVPSSGRI